MRWQTGKCRRAEHAERNARGFSSRAHPTAEMWKHGQMSGADVGNFAICLGLADDHRGELSRSGALCEQTICVFHHILQRQILTSE